MKKALQAAVLVLCVAFSGLAVFNVLADNAELVELAKGVACAPEAATCKAQMTQNGRSPFGQTFVFSSGKASVGVTCRRAAIVAGPYACSKQPGG